MTDKELSSQLAVLNERTAIIVQDIAEMKGDLRSMYVTQAELDPIKKVVYGLVGLILTGVIGGMLALVLKAT